MRQMLTLANSRSRCTEELKAAALEQLGKQRDPWVKLRLAAVAINRHRSTVYRWYQHDPAFRIAVDSINERNMQIHLKRLEREEREEAVRRAQVNMRWLELRQRQAAHARSCKRRRRA